jgi:hypothetical protein
MTSKSFREPPVILKIVPEDGLLIAMTCMTNKREGRQEQYSEVAFGKIV